MENRYQELAKKWLDKTITPDEQAEFAAWYNADQNTPVNIPSSFAENEDILKERILNKINRDIKKHDNRFKIIVPVWLRVAASLLLFAGCFICYYVHTHPPVKQQPFANQNPT
jgi:transmembrane sensor